MKFHHSSGHAIPMGTQGNQVCRHRACSACPCRQALGEVEDEQTAASYLAIQKPHTEAHEVVKTAAIPRRGLRVSPP